MCPKSTEQLLEIRSGRKESIENAALICFAHKGYHACTISDIAKEAGISKGLLYNYYKSKEELLSILFLNFSEEIMRRLDPNKNHIIEDHEAEEFVDKYFDFMEENREYCKLFIQVSVQPGILEMLMKGETGRKTAENQNALYNYFRRLSKGTAEVDLMFFTSLLKGFSLQFVFAPDQISRAQIRGIKEMLLVILNRKVR